MFCSQTWIQILASQASGQETFGKSPYLSESQFPHLDDRVMMLSLRSCWWVS